MKTTRQKAEGRRQKAEDTQSALRPPPSDFRPQSSDLRPLLIVISAPSGGGKTTLCNQLLAARPDMTRAVTCTTRDPRPGERDGVDYYFLDASSFLKRVQAGNFLEHATVYGHSYGTLKAEVLGKLRSGRDVLLNVDVQGANSIRQQAEAEPELKRSLVTVFLTPASLGILEERLRRRGQDSPEVIKKRLAVARQEIAQWRNFDYLIISRAIEQDLKCMQAVVLAEKMRSTRAQAPEFSMPPASDLNLNPDLNLSPEDPGKPGGQIKSKNKIKSKKTVPANVSGK